MAFEPFLTSYDPSDLPGNSIDPLGFDRGYGLLADKILPGLTNVANQPRYFSMLCTGTRLAADVTAATSREQAKARRDVVLRFERLWALANVLAASEDLPTQGLRGVLRVTDVAADLRAQGKTRTKLDFHILSRQERYGAIGIYGNVADELRLLDRKTFTLTPDLGDRLAEAFLDATEVPSAIRRAALKDEDVALSALASWGERSHVSSEPGAAEARCLHDALHRDPVRTRMVELLDETPWKKRDDSELRRIGRVLKKIEGDEETRDLYESLRCVLAFEACYGAVLLGFERVLWLCRAAVSGAISVEELADDPVIHEVSANLAPCHEKLEQAVSDTRTEWCRRDIGRLDDVRTFLAQASAGSPMVLVAALLERHDAVQRGKWDQGRPKLPWVRRHDGGVSLTLANAGGFDHEPKEVTQVAPHPYRLQAADALSRAAGAA